MHLITAGKDELMKDIRKSGFEKEIINVVAH